LRNNKLVKKATTYTMAYLLATMFLLSFTGIRMLIHHCLSCNTTDVALFSFAADECDIHQHHNEAVCHIPVSGEAGSGCCETEHDEEGDACGQCCKTEVHYLKNDYQVSQERNEQRIEPVVVAVLTSIYVDSDEQPIPGKQHNHFTNTDPPKPVGRDFLIFANQLKIM